MFENSLSQVPETQQEQDMYFMKQALIEAKKAFDKEEVPVGSVLVHENKIIAKGHNQVELLKDATAHAEMLCLTAGSEALSNWRLLNTTLYITLEPCVMCVGAMFSARVKRVVWAAPDLRLGAGGSFVDLFSKEHPMHEIEIAKGVLEEESSDLLRAFFQIQRNKKAKKKNF